MNKKKFYILKAFKLPELELRTGLLSSGVRGEGDRAGALVLQWK